MSRKKESGSFIDILVGKKPDAIANVRGASNYPRLRGTVKFYRLKEGVMVIAECKGIFAASGSCTNRVHGFHIHAGNSCSGTVSDPFAAADGHFNPTDCPHPSHAGDMPPLFSTESGQAWSAFLSDRFTLGEVLGKTVILHANVDDFTSQPSGNSGAMIGCGVIKLVR